MNQKKDQDTSLINMEQVEELFLEEHSPSSIYKAVRTKALMDRFLIEKLNMVPAESLMLGVEYKWKKRKVCGKVQPWLCKVNEDAFIVPFLNNLENLVKNEAVQSNIDNPRPRRNGLYRSVLDGSYYTNDDDFFKNNEKAIGIIFYQDDVSTTHFFSGVSKEYQVSM